MIVYSWVNILSSIPGVRADRVLWLCDADGPVWHDHRQSRCSPAGVWRQAGQLGGRQLQNHRQTQTTRRDCYRWVDFSHSSHSGFISIYLLIYSNVSILTCRHLCNRQSETLYQHTPTVCMYICVAKYYCCCSFNSRRCQHCSRILQESWQDKGGLLWWGREAMVQDWRHWRIWRGRFPQDHR